MRKRQSDAVIAAQEKHSKPLQTSSKSNAVSPYQTVEEEREARLEAVTGQLRILKSQLPCLLKRLEKIPDPRQPRKTKHKFSVLMLYGLLMFVFQFPSRRNVNEVMTNPQFIENLRLLFPEIDALPHADTLFRLLQKIDVSHLEEAHIDIIQHFIRNKKFRRYLINNCYPIAIDGTQKLAAHECWCEELLQRKTKKNPSTEKGATHESASTREPVADDQENYQYYIYVVEANFSFQNGLVIPLLSEFLEFEKGDINHNKQDCENRGFKRLCERLNKLFPKLAIMLLLDGLYANGPILACCQSYHWQFMIVLKDNSLPSVWEEFRELKKGALDNRISQRWGKRLQDFQWVNDIEYYYGPNQSQKITVHVVVCNEQWEEINTQGEVITKHSRHAWLSSRALNKDNIHERCNLGARYRWGIESCILVEKHQGYHYEHCFAKDWNALRGYHYLMRMAHLFNTLARFSTVLSSFYRRLGVEGFIRFVRDTIAAPWLDREQTVNRMNQSFQLRLE